MKFRFGSLASIAVLAVLVSIPLVAQDKAQKGEKKQELQNVQGTITNMSKDTSTITVRTTGTTTRAVVFNAKTKFLYGHSDNNKPGAVAQIKDSYFISCAGTFDAKGQLMANECVYRETK
jgi:hypothetical protein